MNAVLAARQIAVERRSQRDVEDLGEAVQKLGYVVRTEGRAQFWRPLVQAQGKVWRTDDVDHWIHEHRPEPN